jgi:DNA-binding transcriptional LysR family regulator
MPLGRRIHRISSTPAFLQDLEDGHVVRLLPEWRADAGAISVHFVARSLLPSKMRAFIDLIDAAFRECWLTERFAGDPSPASQPEG